MLVAKRRKFEDFLILWLRKPRLESSLCCYLFRIKVFLTSRCGEYPGVKNVTPLWQILATPLQPAPRWRLLSYLANPGKRAMSPHAGRRDRHLPLWKRVERGEEGSGGRNCPEDKQPCKSSLRTVTQECPSPKHMLYLHMSMCQHRCLQRNASTLCC